MQRLALVVVLMLVVVLPMTAVQGSENGAGRVMGPTAQEESPWQVERVDAPKLFGISNRSLALDSAGYPHIAYGGDFLYYAWYDGVQWHRETVDDSRGVGSYASLVLDHADRPHISYLDGINGDLKYARYDGVSWNIETVDSGGGSTSLALDGADRPHISYCLYGSYHCNGLKYAHYDGTRWITELVDGSERVGYGSSLAVDQDGHPMISYLDEKNYDLRFARYNGTAWTVETVDDGDDVGWGSSLALDELGRPRISYVGIGGLYYASYDGLSWHIEIVSPGWGGSTSLDLDPGDFPHISGLVMCPGATEKRAPSPIYSLVHIYYNGSTWQSETLVGCSEGIRQISSVAVDASGRPHISYQHAFQLYYAYDDGTGWQSQVVDEERETGIESSLVLDNWGRPRISYYEKLTSSLFYAHRSGASWIIEAIDSTGDVGWGSSLDLDDQGWPHISYGSRSGLKYAYFDGTAWITETASDTGLEVGSTSLQLDSTGRPHISYHVVDEHGFHTLKYAYYDGTSWLTEVLNTGRYVGRGSSLALDAWGLPHISYCTLSFSNYDCFALYYASYNGTSWQLEVVDPAPGAGDFSSLVLDHAGRPHISYVRSDGKLNYAYYDGTTWQIMTADSTGYNSLGSLQLDSLDSPHVSYCGSSDTLKYAYYDGYAWQIEPVAAHLGYSGGSSSLALDAGGQAHISYFDGTTYDLMYASRSCTSLTSAALSGPVQLPLGIEGVYSATYTPAEATPPISFGWSNGALGATAAYSWSVTGTQVLSVTAANDCSAASGTYTVTVFCQPVEGAGIEGPGALLVGQEGLYRATWQPLTASVPLSVTWDSGAMGPTAAYSWTVTGTQLLWMTVANACGEERAASFQVRVLEEWPYRIYLMVVGKE